jgi:hypothetical protein
VAAVSAARPKRSAALHARVGFLPYHVMTSALKSHPAAKATSYSLK